MDLHRRVLSSLWTRLRRRRIFASKRDVYRAMITALLASLPLIAAWDYGGVLPYTQWYLAVAVLLITGLGLPIWIEFLWRLGERCGSFVPAQSWIPILVLLIVAIGWVQTITWPAGASKWLSPATHAAYSEWIPESIVDESQASSGEQQQHSGFSLSQFDPTIMTHPLSTGQSIAQAHPLSVAPWMTRRALYGPSVFGLLVLLATILFRNPSRVKLFFAITGCFGAILGFVGIADVVTTDSGEKWVSVGATSAAPFASFVNRNNAGGYLNLTLACSLGYLVWRHAAMVATARRQRGYRRSYDTGTQSRVERMVRKAITASENAPLALVCVLVTIAAIVACGSRGAVLGAFSGMVCIALLRLDGASTNVVTRIAAAILGVLVIGVVSLTHTIGSRIATLWQSDFAQDGRLDHWADALSAGVSYLPMGSGLGTYRFAYLPYQDRSSQSWYYNADGMPIEWILEGGVWLLPLVIGCVVIVACMLIQIAKTNRTPYGHAITVCGSFMVCSQIVSQSFDFGILLPANLMTCALVTGAIVAAYAAHRARLQKTVLPEQVMPNGKPRSEQHEMGSKRHSFVATRLWQPFTRCCPVFFVLFVAAVAIACRDAKTDAIADYRMRSVAHVSMDEWLRFSSRADGGAELDEGPLASLSSLHPIDAKAALAEASALVMRDQAAAALAVLDVDRQQAERTFQDAKPGSRRAIFHLQDVTGIDVTRRGLMPGQSIDRLVQARERAIEALIACPLSDDARRRLLSLDFLGDSFALPSKQLIQQSAQLRRNTPSALVSVAKLASVYPGVESAAPVWRQLIELQPNQLRTAWKWLTLVDQTSQLADCLPPRLPVYVDAIEELPLSTKQKHELLAKAHLIAGDIAGDSNQQDDSENLFAFGRLAAINGDWASAQAFFRRAVDENPTRTAWRYRLAIAAEKNKDTATALAELERCMLQKPDNSQYQEKARVLNDPRK